MTAASAIERIVTHSIWSRPWVRRTATLLFFAIVTVLIARQVRTIEWTEVAHSIGSYGGDTLAFATALSALSYLFYSCYDLLSRWYANLRLPAQNIMSIAFVAYAFNQSLGSLIGTVAFRFRLYSRLGVDAVTISKIVALSVATNWLGYAAIAGTLFASGWIELPSKWEVGESVLRGIGVLLVCTAVAYLLSCGLSKRREFDIHGRRFQLPSLSLAVSQLMLSLLHWPVAAAIVFILLDAQIEFVTVLGALLLTAVAVVLTHIPAGIGVLEAIFLAMLTGRMPATRVLAALLVFRAVYYLLPLAVATLIFVRAELGARRRIIPANAAAARRCEHVGSG